MRRYFSLGGLFILAFAMFLPWGSFVLKSGQPIEVPLYLSSQNPSLVSNSGQIGYLGNLNLFTIMAGILLVSIIIGFICIIAWEKLYELSYIAGLLAIGSFVLWTIGTQTLTANGVNFLGMSTSYGSLAALLGGAVLFVAPPNKIISFTSPHALRSTVMQDIKRALIKGKTRNKI